MGRLEIARLTKSKAQKTALETASQILLYYNGFRPALIELAYAQAENGDWDMSMEPVQISPLAIGGNTIRQRIVGHKNLIFLLQITGRFVLI